jgi:hypothetical protein
MDERLDPGVQMIRNHIEKDPGMPPGSENYNSLVKDCREWLLQDGNEGTRLVDLANICAEFDEWSKAKHRRFFDLAYKSIEKPIKPDAFVEHLISAGTPGAVDSYLAPLVASFPRKGKGQIKALSFRKPPSFSISQPLAEKASRKPGFRPLCILGNALAANKDSTKEEGFQAWLGVFTHNLIECVRISEGMAKDQQLADEINSIHATLAGIACENNQLESAARSAASTLVPLILGHPQLQGNFLSQSPFFSGIPASSTQGPEGKPATISNPEPTTQTSKDMFKDVFDRWPEKLKQHLIPVALFFNELWDSNKKLESQVKDWQTEFKELARDVGREKIQKLPPHTQTPDPQTSIKQNELENQITHLEQENTKLRADINKMEKEWAQPDVWKKNQSDLEELQKKCKTLEGNNIAYKEELDSLACKFKTIEGERDSAKTRADSLEKKADDSAIAARIANAQKETAVQASKVAQEENERRRIQFESDVQGRIQDKLSSIRAILEFDFDQIAQIIQNPIGPNQQEALSKMWASFSKKVQEQLELAR